MKKNQILRPYKGQTYYRGTSDPCFRVLLEDPEIVALIIAAFLGEMISQGELLGKDLHHGDALEALRRIFRKLSVKKLVKMLEKAFKTVIHIQKTPDSPFVEFEGGGEIIRDFLEKGDNLLQLIEGFSYKGQPDGILFDTHRNRIVSLDMQVKPHPRQSLRFFLYGVFLLARQMVPGFELKDVKKVTVLALYSGETAGQKHWEASPKEWIRHRQMEGGETGDEALDVTLHDRGQFRQLHAPKP
jgi:hypothetical protein